MQTICVAPPGIDRFFPVAHTSDVVISGTRVPLACVETDQPTFDSVSSVNARKVLVRVEAFSCNYRDKAIIVKHALKRNNFPTKGVPPFGFFGSDFVGRVEAIGPEVTSLQVGDRVIPDCSYPVARDDSAAPGVVTNEASKGWLILDEAKLMDIPESMPDEVAAGFSIGGQTAASLVRRTVSSDSDRVLVTSGRSNTAQFASWVLRQKGIACDLVTTSKWTKEELSFISPCKVVNVARGADWASSLGKDSYDVIIDPFFDLHIDSSVDLLRSGGRYITCGYKNQHASFQDEIDSSFNLDLHSLMMRAMIKNVTLAGNCIGYSDDLRSAIDMFEISHQYPMPIDNVYRHQQASRFLDRTFNDSQRLGKAVLQYDSP